MNILICDDISDEAAKLESVIEKSGFDVSSILLFNGDDVLYFMESGAKIDLCFLDILMPNMTGIELASRLRYMGYNGDIVFLTTSNEYAAESYRVDAFSYLLKPPNPNCVVDILRKAMEAKLAKDTLGILVVTRSMSRFVLFHELYYAEAMLHKVIFHLTDGSALEATMTFNELIPKLLKDSRFNWCHRSFIVNMDYIKAVVQYDFILSDGRLVPIRSTKRADSVNKYEQYRFEQIWRQQ